MQAFRPPALLRDRHLQSVLGSSALRRRMILRAAAPMLASTEDLIADCGEGVRLLVHHSPPPREPAVGTVVLLHGWEGSGNATYVVSVAARLRARGFRILRLNLRDHGESHHLNRGLFHSCRLDEVAGAVAWAQARYPDEPLMLGGFSLGGNFALRVAAIAPERGIHIQQVGAVCPVLDPVDTMDALDNGLFFYRRYFLQKWRRSLLRKAEVFPDDYQFGDLRRFRTLEAMTDFFIREYADFDDLFTYLRGYALTGDRLAALQVPSRVLVASDDPVIPVTGLERLARPAALQIIRSDYGGHCAFLNNYRLQSLADDFLLDVFCSTHDSRSEVP